MQANRKVARQRLKQATRTEFENLILQSNLTPIQEKIIRLHIAKDFSVCKLALKFNFGESTIKKILMKVYEKISKFNFS